MKKFLSLLVALVAATSAFAIRFEQGDNVRISTPVNEDIYVAAGTISLEAIVRGDFFAAGGTVTLSDTVTGDVAVAGGTIMLRGTVLDDVRSAGGNLTISGYVGGDLLITGGTVTVEPGAVIAGDVYISGGTLRMGGAVRGNLKTASGEVVLDGSIAKNADLNGGKITLNGSIGGEAVLVAQTIKVEPNASLGGKVRYWTEGGEVDFGTALKGGTATFDASLAHRFSQPKPHFLGFATFFAVMGYLLAMLILLAVGQRLFGPFFSQTVEKVQREPVRALGYGFLYFVVVPVGIVMLFMTVIGIPLGLIGLFFYLLFLALANVITALVGVHWWKARQGYQWNFWKMVLAALGVLVLLKLLWFLPFVGWLAKLLAVCTAFGAVLLTSRLFQQPVSNSI